MPLSLPVPTSRKNAVASFVKWVNDNVIPSCPANGIPLSFKLQETSWENTEAYPNITIVERGMPDLGPLAWKDAAGSDNASNDFHATMRQTIVEINIQDRRSDGNAQAEKVVRLAREVLWQTLYYSGQTDSSGTLLAPSIPILNFDVAGNPATDGYVWWPDEETNTWFETLYLSESSDPELKRIQIMLRLRWFEFR